MINRQCDIDSKGSKVITQLMIMGKPLVKATRVDLPPRVVVELELNNINPPPDKTKEEINTVPYLNKIRKITQAKVTQNLRQND